MGCVAVYDFTLRWDEETTVDVVKARLNDVAKKWCFQLEQGEETGYLHYQGRMSLKVKSRLETIAKKFFCGACHLSQTCTQNMGNDFYVTKDETRVEGPWRDDDEVIYIPRQIRDITEFYPWQWKVYNILKEWDRRSIHVVYDQKGNSGKSIFTTWMMVYKHAMKVPYVNDLKDIMRMVMDMPKYGAYIIDLPRALNKDKMYNFYSGMEDVKNGYAYDDRYHFKHDVFDCPQIVIFTNRLPPEEMLSRDRWVVWTIQALDLVRYHGELPSVAVDDASAFHCNNNFKLPEQPEHQNSDASLEKLAALALENSSQQSCSS